MVMGRWAGNGNVDCAEGTSRRLRDHESIGRLGFDVLGSDGFCSAEGGRGGLEHILRAAASVVAGSAGQGTGRRGFRRPPGQKVRGIGRAQGCGGRSGPLSEGEERPSRLMGVKTGD